MIIAVASGKGGTGKTTVAVNLALTLSEGVFLDCDVEEPNAGIFLKPQIEETGDVDLPVPKVDKKLCNFCGRCREVCAYNALAVIPPDSPAHKGELLFFPHLCHSCGACVALCPRQALREEPREIGRLEAGKAGDLIFVQGKLKVGEIASPALIEAVKERIDPGAVNIIDCPPGTGCPAVAALRGCDFVLLVTEPTPFGLHDLTLAADLLKKMRLPAGVVINRCDLGDKRVERFCRSRMLPVLLRIPFEREIAERYSRGESLPGWKNRFKELFAGIRQELSSCGK